MTDGPRHGAQLGAVTRGPGPLTALGLVGFWAAAGAGLAYASGGTPTTGATIGAVFGAVGVAWASTVDFGRDA